MGDDDWSAPTAAGPLRATVRVPGSKSLTNRALVLAAIAAAPGTIADPLRSRDTSLMVSAVRALGARVDDDGSRWRVTPSARGADGAVGTGDAVTVDVGNAGTVLRFTPPLAALGGRPVRFDGDDAVRRRPVGGLLAALRALGARVDGDTVPFVVHGSGTLQGGELAIDASSSSQLVSALLLAGAAAARGVTVRHTGERPVPNTPHLRMTAAALRARDVTVDDAVPGRWRVEPGPVSAVDAEIEPDLSSAAPFLAAAVATGGSVTVAGWPETTTQPGGELPAILERFGASVRRGADGLTVTGGGRIAGVELDLRDAGELTPVVAALAALADGPSQLSGVDYLRGHETDRLAALRTELGRLGTDVTEAADGLRIRPKPLRGGVFASYDDHRMVMAAAVLGTVVPGVIVAGAATVAKTYPAFVTDWQAMVDGSTS